ncbi:uncharacterized protein DS421_20g690970 [Arachis hypogaea]|nr:uncharacterized protein DS421_20g690970 [Arachis hypogaea]
MQNLIAKPLSSSKLPAPTIAVVISSVDGTVTVGNMTAAMYRAEPNVSPIDVFLLVVNHLIEELLLPSRGALGWSSSSCRRKLCAQRHRLPALCIPTRSFLYISLNYVVEYSPRRRLTSSLTVSKHG